MEELIVVTGAAGFIGRNLVAALNKRGQTNLWLVDELEMEEKWRNLRGLFFEDIHSPAKFLQMVEANRLPKIQAVLHLGACSATTEKNADYLLENNYRYTRQLCAWSIQNRARFVYASSAATYGMGELGFSDSDDLTPQLIPLNMYGYSKHLFDLWALRSGALPHIAGLKYFNVYGPYEDHKAEMRSLVQKAYHQIRQEGVVRLFRSLRPEFRDGEQKRDFIYVRDAVDVTLHFMDHPDRGGLFNCGTGTARTWLDLAGALFTAMDRPINIEFIDLPVVLQDKYQYFTEAKMEKLRSAGYTRPFTSLEQGVSEYVKGYLMSRK